MSLSRYLEFRTNTTHVILADFSARAVELEEPVETINWTGSADLRSVADYIDNSRSIATVYGEEGSFTLSAEAVFENGLTDTIDFSIVFADPDPELIDLLSRFRNQHPEFNNGVDYPDSLVSRYVREAIEETGGSGWGSSRDLGVFYFTAHLIKMTYPSGINDTRNSSPSKSIASKTVGDESVSYFQNSAAPGDVQALSSTQYGQRFLALRRRAGMGARAV